MCEQPSQDNVDYEILQTSWHKPGDEQVNDTKPGFHSQMFLPGTAPIEHSFQPHPIDSNIPENSYEGDGYDALDMPGATSKDIRNSIDSLHGSVVLQCGYMRLAFLQNQIILTRRK
ncbi:unnamed protein product [Fusarium venenatum]|uniref:Uncharacterized protein n=1 Tax=Fusarium venenatum TaxID=56646 RepID=A0A2L2T1W9_9HYPO|nr:uncharacterized protein FVRRES_12744 [Fusarium venenatum]CEI40053.1 unnamed protein product [Fusarium venenatum]